MEPPKSRIGQGVGDPCRGFWVVSCYFNPCRYENRLRNCLAFAKGLREQRVNLLMIELCASDAAAHLSDGVGARYMRVISRDVLWSKERLLNEAIECGLPRNCTGVCWADCDILFQRKDWARATAALLTRHQVVQPFATAIFLSPTETPAKHGRYRPSVAFARYYRQAMGATTLVGTDAVLKAHPGYAWAARMSTLRAIGGLYDRAILGHGDLVMALGLCHSPDRDGPIPGGWEPHWRPGWSAALEDDARRWQRRAADVVRGDVAFVPGEIYHLWHGARKNREYERRGEMLAAFDPAVHIERDPATRMWRWTPQAVEAKYPEKVLDYFKGRKEDDTRQF